MAHLAPAEVGLEVVLVSLEHLDTGGETERKGGLSRPKTVPLSSKTLRPQGQALRRQGKADSLVPQQGLPPLLQHLLQHLLPYLGARDDGLAVVLRLQLARRQVEVQRQPQDLAGRRRHNTPRRQAKAMARASRRRDAASLSEPGGSACCCWNRYGTQCLFEPGGSACCYWNRYGTQCSHPAQGLKDAVSM